jgi:hypothetical protein
METIKMLLRVTLKFFLVLLWVFLQLTMLPFALIVGVLKYGLPKAEKTFDDFIRDVSKKGGEVMKVEALKSLLEKNGDGYLVIDGKKHFSIELLVQKEQVLFEIDAYSEKEPILISEVVRLLRHYPNHEIVTKRICSPLSIDTSIVPPSLLK